MNNLGYFVGGQDSTSAYSKSLWQYTPLALGISPVDNASGIFIFPNPVRNELKIESKKFNLERIEMRNVVGNHLTPSLNPLQGTSVSINVSELARGIYFVTVTDEAGNKTVRKVVKM